MIGKFIAKILGKLLTAALVKKVVIKVIILVLRKHVESTKNDLDNEIVDIVEAALTGKG